MRCWSQFPVRGTTEGQLIARKNMVEALNAFARIAEIDDTLTIVGTGTEALSLVKEAGKLGMAEHIYFVGHQDSANLRRIYSRSQTLVLPSLKEAWGLVVNEALASGMHVVSSTAAGVTGEVAHMRGVFPAEPTSQS